MMEYHIAEIRDYVTILALLTFCVSFHCLIMVWNTTYFLISPTKEHFSCFQV